MHMQMPLASCARLSHDIMCCRSLSPQTVRIYVKPVNWSVWILARSSYLLKSSPDQGFCRTT